MSNGTFGDVQTPCALDTLWNLDVLAEDWELIKTYELLIGINGAWSNGMRTNELPITTNSVSKLSIAKRKLLELIVELFIIFITSVLQFESGPLELQHDAGLNFLHLAIEEYQWDRFQKQLKMRHGLDKSFANCTTLPNGMVFSSSSSWVVERGDRLGCCKRTPDSRIKVIQVFLCKCQITYNIFIDIICYCQ